MKGLLFRNQDLGKGGPDGFLSAHQVWCVELDGNKMHIYKSVTGDYHLPIEQGGGPVIDITVKPCDGSCAKLVEVDEETIRKALEQIDFTDRHLTYQEQTCLPEELVDTTYLSELLTSYNAVKGELEKTRKKARAGSNLFSAINQHFLSWLFKEALAQYKKATQQT